MADDQATTSMGSGAHQPDATEESEVVLEGVLFKLSRSRQWQERHFVFTSNQVLSYSHKKNSPSRRQAFRISRDSGCEIGDLYVEQRHKGSDKEYLYCITISWPEDNSTVASMNNSTRFGNTRLHESFNDDGSFYETLPQGEPSSPSELPSPQGFKHNRIPSLLKAPLRPSRYTRRRSAPATSAGPGRRRERRSSSPFRELHRSNSRDNSYTSGIDEYSITSNGTPNGHRGLRNWLPGKKGKKSHAADLGQSFPELNFEPNTAGRNSRETLSNTEVPSVVNMRLADAFEEEQETEHEVERESRPRLPSRDHSERALRREYSGEFDATVRAGHANLEDKDAAEQEKLHALYFNTQRKEKKEYRKRMVEGTKVAVVAGAVTGVGVMTAGVGLAAGLVFLGAAAAAGGTAGVAEAGYKRKWMKTGKLTIGSTSYEKAKVWKSSLDACLEVESLKESTWGQLFVADGRKTTSAVMPYDLETRAARSRDPLENSHSEERKVNSRSSDLPKGQAQLFLKDRNFFIDSGAQWLPLEGGWTSSLGPGTQSLRIFREEEIATEQHSKKIARLAVGGSTSPLKTQVVLKAQPLDAFMCLMSYARMPLTMPNGVLTPISGQSASFSLLEKIDDHTDIVHLIFRKLYLFPSWTEPRDYVLFRYWRYEPDGSYVICYESIKHALCPPILGFVRGDMHQVCTIAPPKNPDKRRKTSPGVGYSECLLTTVVQVDPKGWVPTFLVPFLSNQTYADAFAVSALLQILDVRDAIDHDRFLDVSPDLPQPVPSNGRSQVGVPSSEDQATTSDLVNYDLRYANSERYDSATLDTLSGLESRPPPLDYKKWAEPDANSFLVRGPKYKNDRVKINAGTSIGRLVAVDLVAVDKPIYTGMSAHPTERIQLALNGEKKLKELGKKSDMPPFIFVVNIILPGPPFYHAVYYYAVDAMSTIDGTDGTGSSRLCQKFLFGESDKFRDQTFKLIPQIVEGNFMVRKAVGSTPAIMGTKLQQFYVRHSRYMEVILNCGSSAVATGVIRLSLGYAKTLMVDMGFLLEGDSEDVLPERIFGCARMKYPDFSAYLRKVDLPPKL